MFVAVTPVAEALVSTVCPDTVRAVVDASPSVVFPVTSSVPPTVSLPVTVEVPTVCVLAVRYVVTALVVVELATIKLVKLASEEAKVVKNPFDVVELVMKALVE